MFVHTLTIERATAGSVDAYNQPSMTYATSSTVRGLVQPKSSREKEQANQVGATASDYSIYFPNGTNLDEGDRVVYASETYQIDGIERRQYGGLPHIKANARKVTD